MQSVKKKPKRLDHRTLRRLTLPSQTERFCAAYFNNGCDAVAAVRTAFPKYAHGTRHTVLRRARLLLQQPEVIKRLEEISQQAMEAEKVDLPYLMSSAKKIADAAPPRGQQYGSSQIKAVEFLAKLTGHLVERKDVNVTVSTAEEQELKKRLAILTEQAQGLGILPSNTIDTEYEEVK